MRNYEVTYGNGAQKIMGKHFTFKDDITSLFGSTAGLDSSKLLRWR